MNDAVGSNDVRPERTSKSYTFPTHYVKDSTSDIHSIPSQALPGRSSAPPFVWILWQGYFLASQIGTLHVLHLQIVSLPQNELLFLPVLSSLLLTLIALHTLHLRCFCLPLESFVGDLTWSEISSCWSSLTLPPPPPPPPPGHVMAPEHMGWPKGPLTRLGENH